MDLEVWQIIAIVGAIIVLLFGVFLFLKKKNKNKKKSNDFPELLEALGGKDNILEVTAQGSRINLVLKNRKEMDKEKLKQNGVNAIIVQSKKIILVVGQSSKKILNYLKNKKN